MRCVLSCTARPVPRSHKPDLAGVIAGGESAAVRIDSRPSSTVALVPVEDLKPVPDGSPQVGPGETAILVLVPRIGLRLRRAADGPARSFLAAMARCAWRPGGPPVGAGPAASALFDQTPLLEGVWALSSALALRFR